MTKLATTTMANDYLMDLFHTRLDYQAWLDSHNDNVWTTPPPGPPPKARSTHYHDNHNNIVVASYCNIGNHQWQFHFINRTVFCSDIKISTLSQSSSSVIPYCDEVTQEWQNVCWKNNKKTNFVKCTILTKKVCSDSQSETVKVKFSA